MKFIKPKKKSSYIIIVSVIILTIMFLIFNKFGLIKFLTLKNEKNNLVEKLEEVKQKNTFLNSQIDSLKNDDGKIEKVAREKYNMKRKGERVIKIENKK